LDQGVHLIANQAGDVAGPVLVNYGLDAVSALAPQPSTDLGAVGTGQRTLRPAGPLVLEHTRF